MPSYNFGAGLEGMSAYGGSAQAMQLRNQLAAQLELLKNPSTLQGKTYDALRASKMADLAAEYGASKSKLEEELAARGLSASTFGAGRYGDLAGQQARAQAAFEAELLKQQSEAEARDRQLYMSTMSDLAGLAGSQDAATYQANLQLNQAKADIGARAATLQQEAALQGRSLDLQAARDQATSEYQRGQLQQGYAQIQANRDIAQAEIGSRENLAQANLTEQQRASKITEGIQQGQLTLQQGIAVNKLAQDIQAGLVPWEQWETITTSMGLDPQKFKLVKPAKP
jgi:hypothetical protein